MTQFVIGHLSPKEVTWDAASAPSATVLILIDPEPVADPRPLKSPTRGTCIRRDTESNLHRLGCCGGGVRSLR